ncbi:Methyltransferase domain-containing protein [Deinococcus reticulitermitis]|uniref:site-specific DNA-methyltransferase (adenine-specific) n=1 Tax=Deinococcus reticulitermitis TaxID=856736 RepID=A0A1H7CA09_9DEIO|nr:N-6 DNA methylase [Deinococcus reticulitermitis]SEJ86468.1 Methyltransferase domain-containing protein [Deinococcus reticulitermitis]
MPALETPLRKTLEKKVIAARDTAEAAASAALARLIGDGPTAPKYLSADEVTLREALLAKQGQLGGRDALIRECAYEGWHAMLFARFLEASGLLMHPDHGVSVTMDDLAELAEEEGDAGAYATAARYAAHMLPGIFRPHDPLLRVTFAPEARQTLERLLDEIPKPAFTADDALGWVYQFWQTARKQQVNASGRKIGGADISPVTQLFTEHYMVQFMLHNTIGAWWTARHPDTPLPTEKSYLRLLPAGDASPAAQHDKVEGGDAESVALNEVKGLTAGPGMGDASATPQHDKLEGGDAPSVTLSAAKGLAFPAEDASPAAQHDKFIPAAGTFPGWPATVKELKVLDPCCGSGHFLVAAFALLRRLRMLEEGLRERDAADAVLRDNLHGLELDPRCTQLAAFNLTLEAWKSGGYRKLPPLNIACSGLSIGATVEDWLPFAPDDTARNVFRTLHEEFRDAPDLGSLINPAEGIRRRLGIFGEQALDGLPELLDTLLEREQTQDPAAAIYGENVQGVARAARLLSGRYHLVITNVPYLARGKQGDTLKTFIERRHPEAKADLATAFVERCRDFAAPGGSYSLVTPQNWLFLGSYKRLRERLLKEQTWDWVARLGTGAFETISGEVVNVSLLTLTNAQPAPTHPMMGLDASEGKSVDAKDAALREGEVVMLGQEGQRGNPDSKIVLEAGDQSILLAEYAIAVQGLATHDDPQFALLFWEFESIGGEWEKLSGTVDKIVDFGGRSYLFPWNGGVGRYYENAMRLKAVGRLGGWKSGAEARGRKGISISQMRDLPATLYTGDFFDHSAAVIVPHNLENLAAIWCFVTDTDYARLVRKIDQALKVTNGSLVKVPFDLAYWQQVAAEKYPDGLPEPYSNDPTQWLFKGTVTDTTEPLQVALARLCGYAWPEQGEDGITPDADGIVPLVALRGEKAAHERLLDVLAGVYGPDWTPERLRGLLAGVGAETLEGWLRDRFFEQHSKLFHHRPFLWHIWDGRKDGFAAIVNYHTLDRPRLEKLTYTYLGAWIDRQRASEDKGADLRLAAALELQAKLEAILLGEPPYDIYVRWKELHEQPRGWNPDLNDGVRLNIRPFVEAGVLRSKVNVKWGKDRGSDPGKVDFQKVHGRDPQTDLEKHQSSERHNDLHFTLREKAEAGRIGEEVEA